MIPEVAAVLEAAIRMVDGPDRLGAVGELTKAVEAYKIRASRPAGAVTYEETDRTWGEVVVQDEILSEKTGRWYEVTRSVTSPDGTSIKLNIKGSAKPIIRPVGDPVKVKRGVLGDAADTLELLWSGTYTLGQYAKDDTTGAGPMIQSHEETQEALQDEGE
jgi:hypothetical protein